MLHEVEAATLNGFDLTPASWSWKCLFRLPSAESESGAPTWTLTRSSGQAFVKWLYFGPQAPFTQEKDGGSPPRRA